MEIQSSVTSAPPCETFSVFISRTIVIIPAHNEVERVGAIVRCLMDRGFSHVRVVDNGSSDTTALVARDAGAEVLRTEEHGYGLACWVGSQNLPADIEWLLYCNADASDDFDAYDEFARLAANYELILGSRTRPDDQAHMTSPQRFGNRLAPALITGSLGASLHRPWPAAHHSSGRLPEVGHA